MRFIVEAKHRKQIIRWVVTVAAVSTWVAESLLAAEEPAKKWKHSA